MAKKRRDPDEDDPIRCRSCGSPTPNPHCEECAPALQLPAAPLPTRLPHEFWVCCGKCAHTWIAAYLPMVMQTFAQLLMGAHCPKCGSDSSKLTWLDRKETA